MSEKNNEINKDSENEEKEIEGNLPNEDVGAESLSKEAEAKLLEDKADAILK